MMERAGFKEDFKGYCVIGLACFICGLCSSCCRDLQSDDLLMRPMTTGDEEMAARKSLKSRVKRLLRAPLQSQSMPRSFEAREDSVRRETSIREANAVLEDVANS